jgi:N-acetylmuramoyl-L-alanine amidase
VTTIEVKNTTNQSARPNGVRPRLIVLHADGAKSAASSINWIMNPVSDVSYHAIIERNGSITQLVPDEAKAWHAGVSMYAGVPGVNDYSIGICLSNRNDGLELYTPQAVQQAVELVAAKMRRWGSMASRRMRSSPVRWVGSRIRGCSSRWRSSSRRFGIGWPVPNQERETWTGYGRIGGSAGCSSSLEES